MTQHYCQRMVWTTWHLFHSRLALVSQSVNSFLVCFATKEREHNSESRFPQKMSCSLVVKAWTPPWMALHKKGELCIKAWGVWMLWQMVHLEMSHGKQKVLYSVLLCKHQLKMLLNLAVIGKPWAYFLATCFVFPNLSQGLSLCCCDRSVRSLKNPNLILRDVGLPSMAC